MSDGPSVVSIIKEVLLTAAAVGGAVVAYLGLGVWKQQLRGTVEWELSRRILRNVYAVRDALRAARSIFMSGGEIAAAQAASPNREPGPNPEAEALIAGYQKRWERVQQALSDLAVETLEGEVLWGSEARGAVAPLLECARDFHISLSQYLSWQTQRAMPAEDYVRKVESVVFPIPNAQRVDEFDVKLQAAVDTAEAFVRPRLKR